MDHGNISVSTLNSVSVLFSALQLCLLRTENQLNDDIYIKGAYFNTIRMIYNIKIGDWNRDDVIQFIKSKKQVGKFTVIDIGGTANGWSGDIIDALCDLNPPNNSHIRYFKCNISKPDDWNTILEYVRANGKFNFSICTHT